MDAADPADVPDESSIAEIPSESSASVAALEAQINELSQREAELQSQLHSACSELAECQAREVAGEKLAKSLQEALTAAEAKAGEKVQSLQEALSAAEAKADAEVKSAAAAKKSSETDVASLQKRIESLTSELELLHNSATQVSEQESTLNEILQRSSVLEASLQDALEGKAAAENKVADLTEALAQNQKVLAAAQGQVEDLTASINASAQKVDETVRVLTSELDELKAAGEASSSSSSAAVKAVKSELAEKVAEIQSMRSNQSVLDAEVKALKEAAAQSEVITKKLTLKLKQKIKEASDLSEELEAHKKRSASSEESSKASMEGRVQQLEASLASRTAEKTDLEAKLKVLNDSVIAGEERISSLLGEKNKLQEDLYATLHKVEIAAKEAHSFKAERDQARQQYLNVETQLQTLSSTSREKIDSLTTKLAEASALNAKLTAQATTATEALALSNSEITTLKGNAATLAQTREKLKAQTAMVESLKQQLSDTKADGDAKAELANDRIKKLKQLLTKVNALAQEKESKLTQYQSLNDRAKKFTIVSRLGVTPPQDPTGPLLEWCLIYEHRSGAGAGAKEDSSKESEGPPQYRWIEQRIAHRWVAEGSTLVGTWPNPLQDTFAADISQLRTRLENERDEVAAKLEDVSAQFQAYKVRAQTALKRIGTEDRNEKLRAQEAENAEIERLRSIIQDMKEKEAEIALILSGKDRDILAREDTIDTLHKKIDSLENAIQDGEQALKVAERKVNMLQKEIESLHEDSRVMKEQYEAADRTNRERKLQQMRADEEAAMRLVKKANADAA